MLLFLNTSDSISWLFIYCSIFLISVFLSVKIFRGATFGPSSGELPHGHPRKKKKKKKRRTGSRRNNFRRFRRSALHYHLVLRCRRRNGNRPPRLDRSYFQSPRTKAHWRWRRRNLKARRRRWKRRVVQHEYFLSGTDSNGFNPELPFSSADIDDFLDGMNLLDVMKTINGLSLANHTENVQKLMSRVESVRLALLKGPTRVNQAKSILSAPPDFYTTPLIYDTGASFGLTPFKADFIDFQEVSIPVKDISKTNYVVGVGTVMYKIKATNGDELLVPGLSYYLPSCDVRLMSPQVYHKLYGGCSVVDGEKVEWRLNKQINMDYVHTIEIPMDEDTNLPMMFDVTCSDEERKNVGPIFTKACAHLRHAKGFFFGKWCITEDEVDYEFGDFTALFAPKVLPCVTHKDNANLSAGQKALLLWHFRLGISCRHVQKLMNSHTVTLADGSKQVHPPVIKPDPPTAADCDLPICPTCKISSAKTTKPPSPTVTKTDTSKEHTLARERYLPGDFISSDQFKVPVPGRSIWGFGKEKEDDMYTCGTVYHDMASSYIWTEFQHTGSTEDTLEGKLRFENFLESIGITIKHLHSDNGIFIAKDFRDDCSSKGQTQTFSGVGAQHQNGAAERAIQTIFWMARTYMLHVALRWNEYDVDSPKLWPFAVQHATWVYNRVPNIKTGLTPLERISGIKADHRDLLRTHVWGSPCYVLDPKLQNSKKLGKFDKRARLGQYLGFSAEHSSLVAVVRHLSTGHVSPQWHVVFDDKFESVFSSGCISDSDFDKVVSILYDETRDWYLEPELDSDGDLTYDLPPLDEVYLSEEERRNRQTRLDQQKGRSRRSREKFEESFLPKFETPSKIVQFDTPAQKEDIGVNDGDSGSEGVPLPESEGENDDDENEVFDEDVEANSWSRRTRSGSKKESTDQKKINIASCSVTWQDALKFSPRQMAHLSESQRRSLSKSEYRHMYKYYDVTLATNRVPPRVSNLSHKKLKYKNRLRNRIEAADHSLMATNLDVPTVEDLMKSPLSKYIHLAANHCNYSGSRKELIANYVHPLFLKAQAQASAADNPTWSQAMNGEFAEEYWDACKLELATLEKMNSWDVVDIPEGRHILGSTWAFKLKRFPDGRPKKWKARFVARGDQQIAGVEFDETYAPVVQWTTVRMMLILECLLGLKSCQADVECAFLHGALEEGEEIYMHMPRGFKQDKKCFRLNKTLYGLRQSPRAFHKFLVESLSKQGLKQSHLDPCLFVGDKVVAVSFVDDCLFWAKDEQDINDCLLKLRNDGLMIEKEGDAAGFLGVDLKKEDGTITMTQTGLIDRIITALGLDDGKAHAKATPAEHKPLVRDTEGLPAEGAFSYSSVVGMLLYLSGHSRPDIAYAVNCCARYMFAPRKSHEEALIRIGLYLKGTRDKGLILTPNDNLLKIEAYPDADFGGLFGHEQPSDPACVKSRTGFVIRVADCPVMWKSQLQSSKTALSTMEAEVTALAHCCRELFPIMDMVKTLGKVYGLEEQITQMNVSIHEDNAGALLLGQTLPPQFTPRSKWYHIETVWFREEIVKRGITLTKICTTEQLGDIFTKGLSKATFEYLRKKLIGW